MKTLLVAAVVSASLTLSCTPSDQPSPAAEATPTAVAGDQITEIDFESGEVEQSAAESEEPEGQPTPLVP